MLRRTLSSVLISVCLAISPAHAQTDPAFEVASVKKVTEPGMIYGIRPIDASGRFYAVVTVYDLFRIAYGSPLALVEAQVVEAPQWMRSDRFEITAKADGPLEQNRLQAMMRALLADRFQLRVRKETRQLPVFDLVLDGGRPGPKLRPADGQCTSIFADAKPDFTRTCGFKRYTATAISALGMSLDGLASGIATRSEVQRVVRNRTGLTGTFDFDIEFMPEPDAPAAAFFTAFREQLGLRFQPATGPLDAYVIERVEPPTPD
jgi:uncharacterized protein (TIGR03435 family)